MVKKNNQWMLDVVNDLEKFCHANSLPIVAHHFAKAKEAMVGQHSCPSCSAAIAQTERPEG